MNTLGMLIVRCVSSRSHDSLCTSCIPLWGQVLICVSCATATETVNVMAKGGNRVGHSKDVTHPEVLESLPEWKDGILVTLKQDECRVRTFASLETIVTGVGIAGLPSTDACRFVSLHPLFFPGGICRCGRPQGISRLCNPTKCLRTPT